MASLVQIATLPSCALEAQIHYDLNLLHPPAALFLSESTSERQSLAPLRFAAGSRLIAVRSKAIQVGTSDSANRSPMIHTSRYTRQPFRFS
ncbi:hypothetical protein [Exiguobacterium sp. s193]|uniref:hypothetical protein n=1 Tax=Exiguobacterium sp. s193 TaxID=2751207 RepID=UPI001BE870F2|nr:hypothetical protein [Exiguobacterium sp. s193]